MSNPTRANTMPIEAFPLSGFLNTRIDNSVVRELSLILPVIRVWMAMLVALVYVASRGSWNYLEYLLLTHCATGVFMAIIWTTFYGAASWRRFTVASVFVFVTSLLGMFLRVLGDGIPHRSIWLTAWCPLFVLVAGFLPANAARRFWGWRIFHVRDVPEHVNQKQFSLRDALVGTAVVAGLCTVARLIVDLLGAADNGWRMAVILYIGVGVPLLAMMSFLSLVSRLGPVLLSVAVPVLSVVIAMLVCAPIVAIDGIDSAVRQVFWPTQFWFMVAGFVLIGVITFLRRKGVVFAFGMDQPDAHKGWKATYAASLRRRIDHHERQVTRLQSELDAL